MFKGQHRVGEDLAKQKINLETRTVATVEIRDQGQRTYWLTWARNIATGEVDVDLQTLHERSGISKRKLRYCIDHRLVPELTIELADDEAGRPRKFGDDVGFGIVCAALLLDLGLAHERIRAFLAGLLAITLSSQSERKRALVTVLERDLPALAYLGDGTNVRLVVEQSSYDSGWYALGNQAKLAESYVPAVTVTLNLGKIRREIFG